MWEPTSREQIRAENAAAIERFRDQAAAVDAQRENERRAAAQAHAELLRAAEEACERARLAVRELERYVNIAPSAATNLAFTRGCELLRRASLGRRSIESGHREELSPIESAADEAVQLVREAEDRYPQHRRSPYVPWGQS